MTGNLQTETWQVAFTFCKAVQNISYSTAFTQLTNTIWASNLEFGIWWQKQSWQYFKYSSWISCIQDMVQSSQVLHVISYHS